MSKLDEIKTRISGLNTCVPVYLGTLANAADDINYLLGELENYKQAFESKTQELRSAITAFENEIDDLERTLSKC